MVDVVGRAKIIIEGDVDNQSFNSSGSKIGSALKKGALVGVAALGVLAAAGVKAGLAFEEAESVQRKLANVLENMGKGGAASAVSDLASSLQKVTGVDDEVIKGGQTILATFSEVAKSAGVVGGSFERATALSVDLAATGFGDVSSGAKALGKALQDPEKGVTLLTRAGVTFTAAQKEQIKGFVETNNLAAAQALILAEVERQVGGTAEAGAKGSEKLKRGFDEVQESVGGLLVSLFEGGKGEKSFIDIAADATFNLSEKINAFEKSKSWKELRSNMREFGGDLKTVASAIGTITTGIDGFLKTISMDEKKGLLYWLNQLDKALNPIRRVIDAIGDVKRGLDSLNDTDGPTISNKDLTNLFLGGSPLPRQRRALGGPASGLTLVGERGPEIVNLPSGSHVYSNEQSRGMGAVTIVHNNYGPVTGSQQRQETDWSLRYGSRFGSLAGAV